MDLLGRDARGVPRAGLFPLVRRRQQNHGQLLREHGNHGRRHVLPDQGRRSLSEGEPSADR